jgi:hypothetical protein
MMVGVLRSCEPFDLEALRREASAAVGVQDFGMGAYGHCVSLPCEDDMPETYRTHHNNLPFADALRLCPLMTRIFREFQTEKASFRLLRRGPGTAYALHDDKDKGRHVVRFQIPIMTNQDAFIVLLKDQVPPPHLAAVVSRILKDAGDDIWFDFERFQNAFGDYLSLYPLPPGYLYYFDTDRIHTAINAGGEDRIVLSIDLVMNDWLRDWMTVNLKTQVPAVPDGAALGGRWNWKSLRHGLITNDETEPNAVR